MRKFLLFLLMTASAVASTWAVTDGVKYEPVNDIKIVNLWIQDRAHTQEQWASQPYCNTYARTAVMHDGYIYITRTNANTVIQGTDTILQSVVYKLDAATGNMIKELPLTLDGAIYGTSTLNANTIGVDNFGHLYIAPYTSELATESTIYLLDGEPLESRGHVCSSYIHLAWHAAWDIINTQLLSFLMQRTYPLQCQRRLRVYQNLHLLLHLQVHLGPWKYRPYLNSS